MLSIPCNLLYSKVSLILFKQTLTLGAEILCFEIISFSSTIFLGFLINVCLIFSSNSCIVSLLSSFIPLICVISLSPISIFIFATSKTVFPSLDICSSILSLVSPCFSAFCGTELVFIISIPVVMSCTFKLIGVSSLIIISQFISLFIFSLLSLWFISLFKFISTVLYTLSPLLILPYILPIVTVWPILPCFMLLFPIISSDILHVPSFMLILSPRFNSFSSFIFV